MRGLQIVLLSLSAAIAYGILHDQVTARVCVEYFTLGHPPVFPTTSPTLLALGWGILATWWVGLPLGMLLALAARLGRRPRLEAAHLRGPVAMLLAGMATGALIAGTLGFLLARAGSIELPASLAHRVPVSRHAVFLADWWAHSASYAVGVLGGVVLTGWVWRERGRRAARAV
jgi:hypothetical protein